MAVITRRFGCDASRATVTCSIFSNRRPYGFLSCFVRRVFVRQLRRARIMVYSTASRLFFYEDGNYYYFVPGQTGHGRYRIVAIFRLASLPCFCDLRQALPVHRCTSSAEVAGNGESFVQRLNYMRRLSRLVFVVQEDGYRVQCQSRVDRVGDPVVHESIFARRSNTIRAGCRVRLLGNCVVGCVVMYALRGQEVRVARERGPIFHRSSEGDSNVSFHGSCIGRAIERFLRRGIRKASKERNKDCPRSFLVLTNWFRRHVSGCILGRQQRTAYVQSSAFSHFLVGGAKYVPRDDYFFD